MHTRSRCLNSSALAKPSMWEMWRILRPTWKTAFSKESEVLVMVVVALGRALEVRLLTQVIRVLDGTLTSRNAALFRAGLLRLLAVSSAGITLTLVNEYLRARQGETDKGVQGAHLDPLGPFLNPPGLFLRTSIPC